MRFWVLRDHMGAALMVAMADAVSGRILEARGPRNAMVSPANADLDALACARTLLPPGRPIASIARASVN